MPTTAHANTARVSLTRASRASRPTGAGPSAARMGLAACIPVFAACFAEPPNVGARDDAAAATSGSSGSTGDIGAAAETTGAPGSSSSTDPTDPPGTEDSTGPATPDDGSTGLATESSGDSSGSPVHPCDGRATTVFVNFDGATLRTGPVDDAPADQTSILDAGQRWAPYAAPDRDAVFATVVDAFAEFNLCVTDVRPASGDYGMVVVTPDTHPSMGLAIAPQDCGNTAGNRDVALVLGLLSAYGTQAKGYVIASVIAGFSGLGLVTNAPDDIMKVDLETNDTDLSFTRACHPLDATASCFPSSCTDEMQSSGDILEAVVGLAR